MMVEKKNTWSRLCLKRELLAETVALLKTKRKMAVEKLWAVPSKKDWFDIYTKPRKAAFLNFSSTLRSIFENVQFQ